MVLQKTHTAFLMNDALKRIHFAVMAIEASAKQQNISGRQMYGRLKRYNLINHRLFRFYELLHTQSLEWVVNDTLETLHNRERENEGREQ